MVSSTLFFGTVPTLPAFLNAHTFAVSAVPLAYRDNGQVFEKSRMNMRANYSIRLPALCIPLFGTVDLHVSHCIVIVTHPASLGKSGATLDA